MRSHPAFVRSTALAAFLAASLAGAFAAPAGAAEVERGQMLTAVTAADVAKALSLEGYAADRSADNRDNPVLLSRTEEGVPFVVLFFDCETAAAEDTEPVRLCGSLVLHATFGGIVGTRRTVATINEWDRQTRFSRAFFDLAGHPVLERDIMIAGGVSPAWLRARLREWGPGLDHYAQKIGYVDPDAADDAGIPGVPDAPEEEEARE